MKQLVKIALALAVLICLVFLWRFLKEAGFAALAQRWIQTAAAWGFWGFLLFVGLYALCSLLLIPVTFLTLGAGAVFGFSQGFLYVLAGANTGALLCFVVSRYLLRTWLSAKLAGHPRLAALDTAIGVEGWKIVLLTRLSPIFPFGVLNYAYGVSRIALHQYMLGTFLGMIPALLAYVYVAAAASTGLSGQLTRTRLLFYAIGAIATIAGAWLITQKARAILHKKLG